MPTVARRGRRCRTSRSQWSTVPPMNPRLAVVSGATGTLGSLVSALLAERGLTVVAVSRSGEPPSPGRAVSVAADVGSDDSIDVIRRALPDGDVVMVLHAIGLPASPGVLDVDPGLLAVATNLKAGGLLRLLRAVDERIAEGTRVVAVGGHLGQEPSEHAPLAGVANAALANLVRQLVRPLGARGASVHLVAPGPFVSPRVERLMAAKAAGDGVSPEDMWAAALAEYPTGAMPTADDVAALIVGLLDVPSHVLTGSMLSLDGGIRRGIF